MILAIVESIQKNYSKKKQKRLVLFAYFLQIFLYDKKIILLFAQQMMCRHTDQLNHGPHQ